MNIKHIIKKVLNENTNPIIKLLNKRGIDPINDIHNSIDFMENTLGLDSNEIIDLYKTILGTDNDEETYYILFNIIFKPDEIYLVPHMYNEIIDSVSFVRDNEDVMFLYFKEYFIGGRLDESCPLLEILNDDNKNTLNKIFGNTWRGPFKKWVYDKFGETVKNIM